jgi:cullin 1
VCLVSLEVPSIDNYESSSNSPRQSLYRSAFENNFFTATSQFYKAESEKFLAENSISEYMKKAELRLEEEVQRVDRYLNPSTLPSLNTLCEARLVEDHNELFKDEFQNLLNLDKVEDMQRMYKLLCRRPSFLDPLRTKLELHVKKVGLSAVEKVIPDSDETQLDAKVYVDAILDVHKKFADLAQIAFNNDPGFVASLDKACREYVNRNAVCKASTSKSPELLARYCDSLLKKSAKNPEEAELEEVLNSIMIVFKFIEDKDVFQKFYSKMLAKRLVSQSSASQDAEALMIAKLKESCGFDYTSKLQRMFTDVGVSKELNDSFKHQMEQNHDATDVVDFSVMVLSTASWPFTGPPTEFNLPDELVPTYERFKGYYGSKHSGRKLTWLFNHSKGEIKAQFSKAKITYTFQVSMYQMGILLQFNNATSYSIEELQELTKLEPSILIGHLGILVKAKILLQDPSDANTGTPKSTYALNQDYKNKKVRMNLNVPLKAEQKTETEETHKTVEEDRKLLIQAAIVRIMKTRKLMKHVALVQEVITQLQSRFKPKIPDIKKCIEILLEKEYIERAEGEKDTFSYVA